VIAVCAFTPIASSIPLVREVFHVEEWNSEFPERYLPTSFLHAPSLPAGLESSHSVEALAFVA
jgi:hypothetical protein